MFRYVEAGAYDEQRGLEYHLASVEPTPYPVATIERARVGAQLDALARALVAEDPAATLEEAQAYVDQLVDAQLLVPDLGIVVTGVEPMDAMVAQLVTAGLSHPAASLAAIGRQLAALDEQGLGVEPASYAAVKEALEALLTSVRASNGEEGGHELNPAHVVQVDLAMAMKEPATLGADVVTEVARAVGVLLQITPRYDDPALMEFRRAFRERWEDREMPLAEVLDEEAGIGFGAATGPGTEGAPLLTSLPFASKKRRVRSWGERDARLLALLHHAIAAGHTPHEVVLTDEDVSELARAVGDGAAARLPDAMSVMIRLGRRHEEAEIRIENVGGPSGARLLGRFCHLDADIDALVREHVADEARLRPDVIFAEVVHLAEGRNANILCRPVLRDHEIVYLGLSGAAAECQIQLDDLLVSVRADRVVLRSRRLGREVVPRLTSAHNVTAHGLGVYRFFAALQSQGADSVSWSWGSLADSSWLPRVRVGRVVLAREQWLLDERELRELAAAWRGKAGGDRRARVFAAMQVMRARRRLPRYLVLIDGDREQFVDLEHQLLVQAFVAELIVRKSARVAEVYPEPEAWVVQGPTGRHACEVVLTVVRESETVATRVVPVSVRPRRLPAPGSLEAAVERRFAPGSRWLYARLYGGVSSADRVLRLAVGPLVREMRTSGAARRWHFVRYADPAPHLRLRLEGEPKRLCAEVMPALELATAPLLKGGALWRVELGTYEREIERYGGPLGIELCEDIFWHDSEAALAIVESLEGEGRASARWQLALCSADRLLSVLGFERDARANLFASARRVLDSEYGTAIALYKAIGARYRSLQQRIDQLLAGDDLRPHTEAADLVSPGLEQLSLRDRQLHTVANQLRELSAAGSLDPDLYEVAGSLVHMSCNRLLHASQRAQELVLYDLLRRHYARHRALAQNEKARRNARA